MTVIEESFNALNEVSLQYDRYQTATNLVLHTAAEKEVNAVDVDGKKTNNEMGRP